MLISIGILAWNEEETIAKTLKSLLHQSVFTELNDNLSQLEWEIIVVPNGCSDNTATVAHTALTDLISQTNLKNISFKIHVLDMSGKSNAWNYYIHELSNKNSELILMIDADIEFKEKETIFNTVQALKQNPNALVAVDLPLKDAEKKKKKTFIEWISTTSSKVTTTGPVGIAGSYYCARAEALKQIWIPIGLPVEDGFIRSMIVTNCFRSKIDNNKIIRAPNSSHYFSTLTTIKEIFKHEVRLVIGTTMNCYLTWDLLLFATDPFGPGAGIIIKNQLKNDPLWYKSLINNSIRNRGYWVLPKGMLFRRFSRLKHTNGISLIKLTIVSIVGFALDLPVFLSANRQLKKGNTIGHW